MLLLLLLLLFVSAVLVVSMTLVCCYGRGNVPRALSVIEVVATVDELRSVELLLMGGWVVVIITGGDMSDMNGSAEQIPWGIGCGTL